MEDQTTNAGVVLVLGTGLLKCAASIGMMRVLDEEQIPIRQIIGAGPGAIFAAAKGLNHSPEQIEGFVKALAGFYAQGKVSLGKRLRVMMPGVLGFDRHFGFLDGDAYQSLFKNYFGGKTFDHLALRVTMVATNFSNGQRVTMTSGELWSAVASSCVIPGYIPPMNRDGQTLIGGAVSDPLPLSIATQSGGNVILTMGFDGAYLPQVKSLGAFMYQLNNIHENHLLNAQATLSNLSYHGEIIPIIPQFGVAIGLEDTRHLSFVMDKGAEATRAVVPYLKKLLEQEF